MMDLKNNQYEATYISIAGFNLSINSTTLDEEFVKKFKEIYRNYLLIKKPKKIDFSLFLIIKNNIQLLKKKNKKNFFLDFFNITNKKVYVNSIVDPLATQIIFRYVLMDLLSKNNGFLFHASGNIIDDQVVLFTGRPGIGKSTTMTLLNNRHKPFVDDIVCIRKIKDKFYGYKTPFYDSSFDIEKEKPHLIRAIFMLERGDLSKIDQIKDKTSITKKLTPQLWAEPEYLKSQAKNIYDFVDSFNGFYRFKTGKINEINKVFNSGLANGLF